MDMQFVFAFDEPPPMLEQLHRLSDALPGDTRLLAFGRMLTAMMGKFAFATTSFRASKP